MLWYEHPNGIRFRKVANQDLFFLFHQKSTSWMSTHQTSFLNQPDQEKWFAKVSNDPTCLILVAIDMEADQKDPTSAVVGAFKITEIHPIHRSAWVGQDVFPEFRRKGYGDRIVKAGTDFCFEVLNLHRVQAEILEENVASQKNFERAGYLIEGARCAAVWKPGGYQDSIMYGKLNTEIAQDA